MKIILTGCTGFIGNEVLNQCRQSRAITSIVVLTRRPLSDDVNADPKAQVIIMKDFKTYPDTVVQQLAGADACIWAMGTTAAIPELEIDYPLAFARAFAPTLAAHGKPFRYMHLSGMLAENDQTKSLLFLQERRRIKGKAENELVSFAKQEAYQGRWETFIAKPAMVLPGAPTMFKALGGYLFSSVRVDELAAAMIDIVRKGSNVEIVQNKELLSRGQVALNGQKEN